MKKKNQKAIWWCFGTVAGSLGILTKGFDFGLGSSSIFLRVNLRKMVWVPAMLVQNLKIPVFCSW